MAADMKTESPFRQRGQSSVEFIIVLSALLLVLWQPVSKELIPAMGRYYQSIVYPISLP